MLITCHMLKKTSIVFFTSIGKRMRSVSFFYSVYYFNLSVVVMNNKCALFNHKYGLEITSSAPPNRYVL